MNKGALLALSIATVFGLNTAASAVTWEKHTIIGEARWFGGNPIGGQPNFTQAVNVDTTSPSHFIQSYGMPVRVNLSLDCNLLDSAPPSNDLLYQKFNLTYNAGVGSERDFSTHTFSAQLSESYVFHTLGCTIVKLDQIEQLTPYTMLRVESGTYSGGIFTPTGVVIDLLTQSSVAVSAGHYRFRAEFDSGNFNRNDSFDYANNSTIAFTSEVVPEPGTMAALGLGAVALVRRRRKSA